MNSSVKNSPLEVWNCEVLSYASHLLDSDPRLNVPSFQQQTWSGVLLTKVACEPTDYRAASSLAEQRSGLQANMRYNRMLWMKS